MKKFITACLLLIALIFLIMYLFRWGQTQPPSEVLSGISGFPLTGKKWTLAFYLAGDNSLEPDQVKNLKEICEGAPKLKDAHVVVFLDRDEETVRENLFTTWKGTRAFYINKTYRDVIKNPLSVPIPVSVAAHRFEEELLGHIPDEKDRGYILNSFTKTKGKYVLKDVSAETKRRLHAIISEKTDYLLPLNGTDYANLDAADARTLSQFVSFVKDNFTSRYYALFIAGHGNGWFVEDTVPPESSRKHHVEYYKDIETPDIQKALSTNPIDVLVLDICFMGDIETAWALRDTSDYLVFNQTSIPSMGLDYDDLLGRLGKHRLLKPKDLAYETVESYRNTYQGKMYPVSATAITLGHDFKAFISTFQSLAENRSNLPALKKAAENARYIPSRSRNRGKIVDLFQYISELKGEEPNTPLTSKSFIRHHCSINTDVQGISIYLPRTKDLYSIDITGYAATDFARDFPQGWVKTLPELIQ